MIRLPSLSFSIFEQHYARAHKSSLATTWNTATSQPSTNGVRMRWCTNIVPSRSLVWSAVVQASQTHPNTFLLTPTVNGCGLATLPLLFVREVNMV